MSNQGVARRYAKALFELGTEQNALDKLTQDVRAVGDTVAKNPELTLVLTNPTVGPAVRKAILNDVVNRLGVSPTVKSAVFLISDHGRAALLPRIADVLADLADERAGKVKAEVTSASPLSEAQYTRLTTALERLTGRKVSLVRKVDPAIIGGVITRIGDKMYDGSVRSRIEEIRQSLLPS